MQLAIANPRIGSDVTVSACASVQGNPCASFLIHQVDANVLKFKVLKGADQTVTSFDPATPLVLRVVDAAGDPVYGAHVSCQVLAFAAAEVQAGDVSSETQTSVNSTRRLVRVETLQLSSASDGSVALTLGEAYTGASLDVEFVASLANGVTQRVNVRIRNL